MSSKASAIREESPPCREAIVGEYRWLPVASLSIMLLACAQCIFDFSGLYLYTAVPCLLKASFSHG